MNSILERLSTYVSELNEHEIEVWISFDPDPDHGRVKKGE